MNPKPEAGSEARQGRRQLERLSHVMVATDFSAGATQAVARAALLPLATGGTLRVVHVLPEKLPARIKRELEQEAHRSLGRAVASAEEAARMAGSAGITVEPVLLRGRAFSELIQHAREQRAELLVLGRRGRRSVQDYVFGSTASRIIRKGASPVLVVNLRPLRPYRKPVIALDLSDVSRTIVEMALRVLGHPPAALPVVHAFNVPFESRMSLVLSRDEFVEYRQEWRAKATRGLRDLLGSLKDLEVHWKPVVRAGDPRVVIGRELLRRRADLVALGTHGRSGVARTLLGSVAEWVLQSAQCDILVTRPTPFSFQPP